MWAHHLEGALGTLLWACPSIIRCQPQALNSQEVPNAKWPQEEELLQCRSASSFLTYTGLRGAPTRSNLHLSMTTNSKLPIITTNTTKYVLGTACGLQSLNLLLY